VPTKGIAGAAPSYPGVPGEQAEGGLWAGQSGVFWSRARGAKGARIQCSNVNAPGELNLWGGAGPAHERAALGGVPGLRGRGKSGGVSSRSLPREVATSYSSSVEASGLPLELARRRRRLSRGLSPWTSFSTAPHLQGGVPPFGPSSRTSSDAGVLCLASSFFLSGNPPRPISPDLRNAR